MVAFQKTQLSRSPLALWSPGGNQLRLFTATTLAPLRELPASPRHLFRRLTSSLFSTEKIVSAMFGWGNQRCLQRYVRHVALLDVRKTGHVTKHMALSYGRSRNSVACAARETVGAEASVVLFSGFYVSVIVVVVLFLFFG